MAAWLGLTLVASGDIAAPGSAIGGSAARTGAWCGAPTPLRDESVAFVPNLGQWAHPARYVARFGAMTAFFEDTGWRFVLAEWQRDQDPAVAKSVDPTPCRAVAVRMTFLGVHRAPAPQPVDELAGVHHFIVGTDATRWRRAVPRFARLRYEQLYAGIDVQVRAGGGHLEYDLLLGPGADLACVEVRVEGVARMYLDGDGALVLTTDLGDIRQPLPETWEVGPSGERRPLPCWFELRGADRFGFAAETRTPGWELVVDPGLTYSTYLGGASYDFVMSAAVDASGNAVLAGHTFSANFPTTLGAFDTTISGATDAVLTRLSASGSALVSSTFFGGSSFDGAAAMALHGDGRVTIAGTTFSADMPTTAGAFDTTSNGAADGFVAQLDAAGANLVFATYIGGADTDSVNSLALAPSGGIAIGGATRSADFPATTGAFDTSYAFDSDAFVARLTPAGSALVYATFLGGERPDEARSVAVAADGTATVCGATRSADYPTTPGAFDETYNDAAGAPYDAFVTRLAPSGSTLVFSTYLGATADDLAYALGVDAGGVTTVAGHTGSAAFPVVVGSYDTSYNGGGDAFVAKLSVSGGALVYSTFLGGTMFERCAGIVLDSSGAVTLTGVSYSSNFPTTRGAFDSSLGGGTDAIVTRLSPDGRRLVYSTLLGGASSDEGNALAVDAAGATTVVGMTLSHDFPTTPGAFDTTHNGNTTDYDAFVTRLDLLPTGVVVVGTPTAGCGGLSVLGVGSMAFAGNAAFSITCNNAPRHAPGSLLLGAAGLSTPIVVAGVRVFVDLAAPLAVLSAQADASGALEAVLPIPASANLVGGTLFAQALWANPTAPPPCPPLGLSASNALAFAIQP